MKRSAALLLLASGGLFACLTLCCGRAPSDAPLPLTGAIRVSAQIETTPVDSIFIKLDNVDQGWLPSGSLLTDIIAGKHQLEASRDDPQSPIDFRSVPRLVTVRPNETTSVVLALTKLAPNFTLKNLRQEEITLAHYQGQVVLLVFFSHT